MAKQGFQLVANNPFVYQECDAGPSAAFGLDNTNSLWRLQVLAAAGATPTAVSHMTIDPAANGNITLTPNGIGRIMLSGVYSVTPAAATTSIAVIDDTGLLGSMALGVTGQVLTGNTGAAPSWQVIPIVDIIWSEELGTTIACDVGHGYIANNVALVTATLPAVAAIGTTIIIVGKGAGGWKIAQNGGQKIRFIDQETTTGVTGWLSSTSQSDCVELLCITANTTWVVRTNTGNLTIDNYV